MDSARAKRNLDVNQAQTQTQQWNQKRLWFSSKREMTIKPGTRVQEVPFIANLSANLRDLLAQWNKQTKGLYKT